MFRLTARFARYCGPARFISALSTFQSWDNSSRLDFRGED